MSEDKSTTPEVVVETTEYVNVSDNLKNRKGKRFARKSGLCTILTLAFFLLVICVLISLTAYFMVVLPRISKSLVRMCDSGQCMFIDEFEADAKDDVVSRISLLSDRLQTIKSSGIETVFFGLPNDLANMDEKFTNAIFEELNSLTARAAYLGVGLILNVEFSTLELDSHYFFEFKGQGINVIMERYDEDLLNRIPSLIVKFKKFTGSRALNLPAVVITLKDYLGMNPDSSTKPSSNFLKSLIELKYYLSNSYEEMVNLLEIEEMSSVSSIWVLDSNFDIYDPSINKDTIDRFSAVLSFLTLSDGSVAFSSKLEFDKIDEANQTVNPLVRDVLINLKELRSYCSVFKDLGNTTISDFRKSGNPSGDGNALGQILQLKRTPLNSQSYKSVIALLNDSNGQFSASGLYPNDVSTDANVIFQSKGSARCDNKFKISPGSIPIDARSTTIITL